MPAQPPKRPGDARARVLIVDDEPPVRMLCRRILERDRLELEEATDGAAALELLDLAEFDVVVTDLRMPRLEGLELLEAIKRHQPDVEVIVITAHGTVEDAIEAMKKGALDFLVKPFDNDELSLAVAKAVERREMAREIRTLRRELQSRIQMGGLIGTSAPMQAVYDLIEHFAPTDSTILVAGESGTGKEVVARTVHARSRRSSGPFVAVNCSAIVREIFESELFGHVRGSFTGAVTDKAGYFRDAQGGTLFLDEITEMPAMSQAKLLRVLQEREVVPVGSTTPIPTDVRVIAASNQDLDAALARGSLRSDLYYRLNVVRIELPPLRERTDDIPQLALHLMQRAAAMAGRPMTGVTADALDALTAYAWPGNVRELANAMEYAVGIASGREIGAAQLPVSIRAQAPRANARVRASAPEPAPADERFPTLDELERLHIERALKRTSGLRRQAAQLLGIDPKTLYRKLIRYQIESDDGAPDDVVADASGAE